MTAPLSQDTLRWILESAILAPSADNQHRVRFTLDENTLRVSYTELALPLLGGYKRALILMSLGALVENLTIAASRFGIRAVPSPLPDPNQSGWTLHLHLQQDQAEIDPLWELIPQRHTNRRVFFRGPKMTCAERTEMDAAVHAFPASQLSWLEDSTMRNQILCLMRCAETERFHTQVLHEELFSAIRFETGWREQCPEGLPPGALGVEPPLRPFFAMLRHWSVMQSVNLLGAHHMMGWRACDLPCRLAPHLGLLTVNNFDDQSVFDVGRAFQRVWLTATQQGRVLQPMPASAIFALGGAALEGVPEKLQRKLAEEWKHVLGEERIPLMLFRMGFAKPLSTVTGRNQIETYLAS